jgi:thioredoxin reductase (NADPH)
MLEEPMSLPVMMAVVGDAGVLAALHRDLQHRYDRDYEVMAVQSPAEAVPVLDECLARNRQVALVIAGHWLPGMTGLELLRVVHERHRQARRVLLVTFGDTSTTGPIRRAMTLGQLDYFVGTPWGPPEERLYPTIGDLLSQWVKVASPSRLELVRVIGEQHAARSRQLRDLLGRNGIPHGFYDTDSPRGRMLLEGLGHPHERRPVVILFDGRMLVDPPNHRIAQVLGARLHPGSGRYDVVIIGAGPAGLASAVYAASEGLRTLVLEREAAGGQASTTSMIRNYLGFPRGISGSELASRATEQAALLGAELVYLDPATDVQPGDPGHPDLVVTLSSGTRITSRAVLIATGVHYRRLAVAGVNELIGAGVFYGAAMTETPMMNGRQVCVVGGASSAGQAAIDLARHATKVTLLVRGEGPEDSMSAYLVKEIEAASNIVVRRNTEVVGLRGTTRLEGLIVQDATTGSREDVVADAVFILIGARPHTEWLARLARDEHGFLLTGTDLAGEGSPRGAWKKARPPLPLETSLPGVFAVGDVRCGSTKRVASAVGEGAAAIALIHQYLRDR